MPTGVSSLFNSVQVTARRTNNHGGEVPAYFGQICGFNSYPISIQSTASAQNYKIQGFQCQPSGNTKLWPMTLSQTTYNAMLAKLTTDKYIYNQNSSSVSSSTDRSTSRASTRTTRDRGTGGRFQVGVNNNSTKVLSAQIQSGVTTGQVATAGSGGTLQLGSSTPLRATALATRGSAWGSRTR